MIVNSEIQIWAATCLDTPRQIDSCRIVGVLTQPRMFHRCAAANPRGQLFTIDECSAGQVMDIHFAEIGYSESYNPDAIPAAQCPWRNCTKPSHTAARFCNGRRRCDIDQDRVIHSDDSPLCLLHRDANFISVNFTCVTGRPTLFSERELKFMFAICRRPSVCLSSVCL